MKRTITIVVTMLLVALTTQAKKVTLTIDGTTRRTQTELYLIINEDIDNAQKLTINDQHFSVTITVDRNDSRGTPSGTNTRKRDALTDGRISEDGDKGRHRTQPEEHHSGMAGILLSQPVHTRCGRNDQWQ